MTAPSARIDAIEAAILSMSQGMTALTQTIAAMNQPQAPQPTTPPPAPKTPQAPKAPKASTPEKITFPKATAGTVTGTIVAHAKRRFGYAMVVDSKEQGKVWINCVMANSGQPLFADLEVGQSVAYVVKESGHVVTDQPLAPKATAPKATAPKATAPKATAPKATTTTKLVEFGPVGDPCPHCGGKHSNEGKQYREIQCLGRIYLAETGKTAGGIWDMPFVSWAHGKRGQTEQASPAPTPAATVDVAAPSVETVAPTVPDQKFNPKIEDGEHTVILREFPRTGSGRVKVHNLTTFNGRDGNGRWMDLYPGLYSKVATFTANDRLVATYKQGVVTRVKRVAQIESDTGLVAGVKPSGTAQPPIQIAGKPDDTQRERSQARRKALRKAS